MFNQIGLVLEGGGMRGVYTAGVLEYFLENDFIFPYVIGVSAGACNAASYLSRQKGRNKKVTIDYSSHPDYISYKNLFRKGQLFGMDLIFDDIPNRLVPFDYETFHNTKEKFVIGTTDCLSGSPVYFEKNEHKENVLTLLRASSSLPLMAPIIQYDDRYLLDGGIADPIPIKKSESDGNKKNVVVLTRNPGYRKKKFKGKWLFKRKYREYEGLIDSLENRPEQYNRTIDYIEQKDNDSVFVIQPTSPMEVGRIERNPKKLLSLYKHGYNDAKKAHSRLEEWLHK
ncbi:patatin-like phospholipase family protein [Pseudalkalibacillus caeni]|uniref:Patatin family protein n=1 Tax=Exobacillus caeni TaxID=2574798 RepID=A0A5R9F540_9BACL|nr:patatin family protein [Pseudalkalibacillus caeni]TLS37589.1 patatin family protein [Pseudalkalibacillus caeni]